MSVRKVSIPSLIRDVKDYIEKREKWESSTKKMDNFLCKVISQKRENREQIYREYIKSMRKLEKHYISTDDSDKVLSYFRTGSPKRSDILGKKVKKFLN